MRNHCNLIESLLYLVEKEIKLIENTISMSDEHYSRLKAQRIELINQTIKFKETLDWIQFPSEKVNDDSK